MAATAFSKKVPYLDTEDTLEEVGISRRQLNYWREKGLFTPEFGDDAKKFTEKDIKLLKFARRLIVEQGFPVEIAKRFIDAAQTSRPWEKADLQDFQYLDITSGALLTKASINYDLWMEFLATADEREAEERLYDLALLVFRLARLPYKDGAAFATRLDEIVKQIRNLAFVARVQWGPIPGEKEPRFYLDPLVTGEKWEEGALEAWLNAEIYRLQKAEFTAREIGATRKQMQRFWDDKTSDALTEWSSGRSRKSKQHGASGSTQDAPDDDLGSFDDVPF